MAVVTLLLLSRAVRIVPQARAGIVERLGRYQRTLNPGLNLLIPLVDRLLPLIDMREQVVSFPPQAVITSDNVGVSIDTVVYYRVVDARATTYEVAQPIQAIEQLTVTTLRNLIGGLDLEQALTSRDEINDRLRTALDEATGPWGIRIGRVELKAIDPPPTIQEAMEKQMRAERDKRAMILQAQGARESAILTAEGEKASAILTAEGQRESAILNAEGDKQAEVLRAEGEAKAIDNVFASLRAGEVSEGILSYLYLEMLPQLADGEANKIFVIPSEFNQALARIGDVMPKPK
ncbi:MAG: SPFH/Band 7/PHB domain protein [Actinomycetota bacterium]|nr:SPFH/Band 7/PHB domain protein [Actinomycetota bacterium]